MIKKCILNGFLAIIFLFSACSTQRSLSPIPVVRKNLDSADQKSITICLGEEPESLYLYSANSQAAKEILQAIYDGPIDLENGEPFPVILEKIPNLEDGSAYFTPVNVIKGAQVINTAGDLVTLQTGVQVFPSGCTSARCAVKWDGTSALKMDYISATYKLIPDLTWSDGQPLTSSDSVYSFTIASDPVTPISKNANEKTVSYLAIDDLSVQWTSKPGLVTDAFEEFFWTPLPEHAWGKYSMGELLTAGDVNSKPLGWGAYKVEEWVEGQSIRLLKNPDYFRANEDLPYFDELVFKFIGPHGVTALSNLKFDRVPFQQFNYDLGDFEKEISENGCDLATATSDLRDQLSVLNILLNYFQDPAIKIFKTASFEDQMMLFNIRENEADTANPSLNLEVRKAVDLCLNRVKAINDLSFGLYDLIDPNFFSNKGLSSQNKASGTYDLTAGTALLDQAGWKDEDNNPDTPRISAGISEIPDGTVLSFRYLVEDIEDNLKSSEIVKASLRECGIGIIIKVVPSETFWDASNTNSIFQGKYDLAQLSWEAPITNPCLLFSSQSIPSSENNFLGINFSGFRNEDFDQACDQLEITHLKSDRDALLEKMGSIINENLPVIPFYRYSKLMIAQKDLCNEGLEMNLNNEFGKIEGFMISPDCR